MSRRSGHGSMGNNKAFANVEQFARRGHSKSLEKKSLKKDAYGVTNDVAEPIQDL